MILNSLYDFVTNDIVLIALISLTISQFLKTIFMIAIEHTFDIRRVFSDGGMPSSHSAIVSSVALWIGLTEGFNTPLFGVAAIFSFIVMHDAKGVRWETSKQAKMLNDMIDLFCRMGRDDISPEKKLKEFVGHTPLQVLMGFILGIIISNLYYYIKFKVLGA
jgi:hypothetical protein